MTTSESGEDFWAKTQTLLARHRRERLFDTPFIKF
jgi:hypothetical protein